MCIEAVLTGISSVFYIVIIVNSPERGGGGGGGGECFITPSTPPVSTPVKLKGECMSL